MLTELQQRKLRRSFEMYDADRDGSITRTDFEQLCDRLARHFGFEPGTPEYEELYAKQMGSWQALQQADTDNDDRISREEFVAAHDALMADREAFRALLSSLAGSVMELQDRDRDGRISRQEYVSGAPVYGIRTEDAEEAFRRQDRDGDGYLSLEDLRRNIEEFYLSDDPEAPGNWINGPF